MDPSEFLHIDDDELRDFLTASDKEVMQYSTASLRKWGCSGTGGPRKFRDELGRKFSKSRPLYTDRWFRYVGNHTPFKNLSGRYLRDDSFGSMVLEFPVEGIIHVSPLDVVPARRYKIINCYDLRMLNGTFGSLAGDNPRSMSSRVALVPDNMPASFGHELNGLLNVRRGWFMDPTEAELISF